MRTASGLSGRVDDPPPDGPRYAAMGNAVTVPVAEWIGRRIVSYEQAKQANPESEGRT
jgi:site-specific DNA-cytosine methylase